MTTSDRPMTRAEVLALIADARARGVTPNLQYAYLEGANLLGVNLRGANLRGANLRGAHLQGANLQGAHWSGLVVLGLPSGGAYLIPTPEGWRLDVGCWREGTVDALEAMIAGTDWPEAEGEEQDRRRPGLTALIALCRAHIAANADVVPALAARWRAA